MQLSIKESKTQTEIRTCTVRLSKLLRGDLPDEVRDVFNEKVSSTAVQITDNVSDLAAIVRATILGFVTGDQNRFPILDVIPEACIRDNSFLDEDEKIAVVPPAPQ